MYLILLFISSLDITYSQYFTGALALLAVAYFNGYNSSWAINRAAQIGYRHEAGVTYLWVEILDAERPQTAGCALPSVPIFLVLLLAWLGLQ